jgi:3-phytase
LEIFVKGILLLCASGALFGCATTPTGPAWAGGETPVIVGATIETQVETDPTVDADDPALWADSADPSRAVMFGTDKTDGLYVHDLDGSVRQFLPSGALNNVDLRTGYSVRRRDDFVLVAATNDQRMGINLFLFDPRTLKTRNYGFVATEMGEPYGFCMGRRADGFYLVANNKQGDIKVWRMANGAGPRAAELVRTMKLPSQLEGCVVDDSGDTIYVGEEDAAIWRFDFDPASTAEPVRVASVDGQRFTADIEGLTIMRDGDQSYLIASSQGDNTFPVFRITPSGEEYIGRFTVAARGTIDAVSHTDGLDAWSEPIGPWPQGALAIHDDNDEPDPGQQNYKLVDWREVKAALDLP